jgi:hypothetical protein
MLRLFCHRAARTTASDEAENGVPATDRKHRTVKDNISNTSRQRAGPRPTSLPSTTRLVVVVFFADISAEAPSAGKYRIRRARPRRCSGHAFRNLSSERRLTMTRLRVGCFSLSFDGFAAGSGEPAFSGLDLPSLAKNATHVVLTR